MRSLKEFLERMPRITKSYIQITEVNPSGEPDATVMVHVKTDLLERKRKEYFARYPFWYWLAKLLNRKEVR